MDGPLCMGAAAKVTAECMERIQKFRKRTSAKMLLRNVQFLLLFNSKT